MHDIQYREAIAWQNVGCNQPPHPGFYLGEQMSAPPRPSLYIPGGTVNPIKGDVNSRNEFRRVVEYETTVQNPDHTA
jgi:rhamnogalacturonan endolyase